VASGPVLARHPPLRRAEYKSQITRVSGGLCRELADALMQAYEWCLRDPHRHGASVESLKTALDPVGGRRSVTAAGAPDTRESRFGTRTFSGKAPGCHQLPKGAALAFDMA
ncbi:MAG TPA: hypothetical protein VK390_02105, partial [Propionibacteriaceae bacterium]|nr:hypothetical protein [Propionibacteriaceae bacterium]